MAKRKAMSPKVNVTPDLRRQGDWQNAKSAVTCRCGRTCSGKGHGGFCGVECRFWAKVQKGPHCWIWQSNVSHAGGAASRQSRPIAPYGTFYCNGRPRRAHRVAWELTYGSIAAGLEILHKCDVTLCVRPDHLRLGTHADNLADAAAKGRLHVSRPGKQKVTPEQIEEIRALVAGGMTHKAAGERFGIARNTVSDLVSGKSRRYDAPLRPSLEQVS